MRAKIWTHHRQTKASTQNDQRSEETP